MEHKGASLKVLINYPLTNNKEHNLPAANHNEFQKKYSKNIHSFTLSNEEKVLQTRKVYLF